MAIYKTMECDVLVIGSGGAGFCAAIKARDSAERVILVEKAHHGRSGCSPFAAGIWTIKFPEDNTEAYMREIIEWGEYLSDQEWVKTFLDLIYPVSMELEEWAQKYGKAVFEKDGQGNFIRRQSRGHLNTTHCVFNSFPMIDTVKRKAKEKGVTFVERTMVTDLVTSGDRVVGAVGLNYRTGDVYLFKAKAVIVAAGKIDFSKVFMATKNLSGELVAASYRAGAELFNLEMSGSNTCARDFYIHGLNLIVGSGGRFLNGRGEEFMWEYDPVLGNRATLQPLTIAMCHEVKEGRGPIFLDMSRVSASDKELMRKILPHSFKTWERSGMDFFKDQVPWIPVPLMGYIGGVKVNTRCESSLSGLYVAGDASGQPHHGAYSIGGLAVTYAYLSGWIAGQQAAQAVAGVDDPAWDKAHLDEQVRDVMKGYTEPFDRRQGVDPRDVLWKIQEILVPYSMSYVRTGERLTKALGEIERIRAEEIPSMKAVEVRDLVKVQEVRSLGLMAELLLRSALVRKESRGFHFREDYPYTDNRNWLKWVMVKQAEGKPEVWTRDVPTPYLAPKDPIAIPYGVKRGGQTHGN